MKGIILAGGTGSRLYPITKSISKQLLPIYDKPMIYYPLSTLMLSGIKEILIISTPNDLPFYKKLLGNGSNLGLKLFYKEQIKPNGIPQAFIIGEKFIGNHDVCLILGDNIFYGNGLSKLLQNAKNKLKNTKKSQVFCYPVSDPERFGIINLDSNSKPKSIVEKPKSSKSNLAVVGLYFYSNDVIEVSKNIKLSKRGEYEITSINEHYLNLQTLDVNILTRGFTWLDTGTHDSLLEASNFVKTIEKRSGYKVSCLEEIAYKMNYIDDKKLIKITSSFKNTDYVNYLKRLLK